MSAINPQHYKQGNIEVIDFILDQKMSYLIASATKYLCRFPHKHSAGEGRLDDLRKARWFIEKQIEEIKNFIINRSKYSSNQVKLTSANTISQ